MIKIRRYAYNGCDKHREVSMLENVNIEERSELVEKANALRPQFKTNAEAISFYSQALEALSTKNGYSIQDFLMLAETQVEHSPDLLKALSLARTIKSLRTA